MKSLSIMLLGSDKPNDDDPQNHTAPIAGFVVRAENEINTDILETAVQEAVRQLGMTVTPWHIASDEGSLFE